MVNINEEYEPCVHCDKPVSHSSGNWRAIPPEAGETGTQGVCLICDDCIRLEEDNLQDLDE